MAKNREDLINQVTLGGQRSLWDAFDQGRLGFHSGELLSSNPWRLYPGYSHVNIGEWEAGWISEQSQSAYENAA